MKLSDIARLAGVSVTTASYVINGKAEQQRISSSTVERVRAVVEAHGFTPNPQAAGLRSRHTRTLGFILPDLENPSYARIAKQLEQGAPRIEQVAAHMNMSARNLQRKLADEGTSLAFILDEIRQSEAQRRLKQSQDSLTAIALDLGFSDASAFSRACKRWFGKSPSDIRSA